MVQGGDHSTTKLIGISGTQNGTLNDESTTNDKGATKCSLFLCILSTTNDPFLVLKMAVVLKIRGVVLSESTTTFEAL